MSETDPRSPRLRSAVFLLLGVVVLPAIVWAIGLVLEQVLLVAAAGAVAAAALRFIPPADDPGWPEEPQSDRDRGARRDVSRLSWSTSGSGEIGGFTLRRLGAVGARRLARHGLDLDDPADRGAAVALIGEVAYGVLTAEVSEPIDGRRFTATMTALEALDPSDQPIHQHSKQPNTRGAA